MISFEFKYAKIFSIVVVLAIISTTVFSDKNVTNVLTNTNKYETDELLNSNNYNYITIELPSSNKTLTKELLLILNETLNENANSIVKINIDTYVDPDVDKVWKMYLLEKKNRFKEKLRMTTAMRKENAVTVRIKPIIEKGANNHKEREAASNNNLTSKTKKFSIRTDDSAVNNTSTNGYQDDTNTERANMSNVIESNNIIKDPFHDDDVLELVPFLNANASAVNDTGQKSSRRQKTKLTKQGKLLLKMAEFAGKGRMKFERYREPYWKFGDYVFLRTGSPTTPLNVTGKWAFGEEKPTVNPMEVFRDCDRVCSHYYKAYGLVCGHRLITRHWRNQYKNFNNICDMDHENCVNPLSRPHWHPIYKGQCGELREFWQPPYDYTWIRYNADRWEPFVYVPPTPTDPTADPLDEELKKALLQTEADAAKAKEG